MIKINKENLNKPPKTRKQLKTISVEIQICSCCGQDLEIKRDDYGTEIGFKCNTKDCGYEWYGQINEKNCS